MKKILFIMLTLSLILQSGCENQSEKAKTSSEKTNQSQTSTSNQINNSLKPEPFEISQENPQCPIEKTEKQEKTEKKIFSTCAGVQFSLNIPEGFTYQISDNNNFYNLIIFDKNKFYRLDVTMNFSKNENMEEFKNMVVKAYGEWLDINKWHIHGYELNRERFNKDIIERNVPRESDGGEWIIKSFLYPLKAPFENKFISLDAGASDRTEISSSEIDAIIESFQLIQ